ncbi:uncharacterized protein [Physcomitrium patens]|uniref:Uncharacterized protein n=1 Tax=Physcomitrium patens TaxID=3218 RepID=A0A2K1JC37_PHYPA|nr:uncharacterized protein LOC112292541 [Physcomitrium patens]XP_024396889.1 uncharacterized protein LOC112292541 [Physcomitrium patens]PNR39092.1 hypothetical protein PHYPA_019370 [Physcomitrium patens]|eukprot:XP_024396888.1 uncharacterized protein LOC112292541 [Physcomitrella patens]
MSFNSRSLSRIISVPGQRTSGSEIYENSSSEQIARFNFHENEPPRFHFPGAVRKFAYRFDGNGKFFKKTWDLMMEVSEGFCWYHVELPRSSQKLSMSAEYLIDVLCPPLKLQEILALVSSGPFCGTVDGALVFRVNSAGPCASKFTQRISALVTDKRVISVSLGRVSRLDFSIASARSLLSEVPLIEPKEQSCGEGLSYIGTTKSGGVVIQEHVLEFLLSRNTFEEAENAIPRGLGNLLVHIIDTHVDQLHEIVLQLESQLDEVERDLDIGVGATKKQMLDDRRFPKMHLNLQRLLQVIAHGDQVFPRVKDKCAGKPWCSSEDLAMLEALVGRLRKLKGNAGFIVSRITAIQAGLDSWQAEQINRKLYYLSFLSMLFLPLSIVTGAFGMNVGGVPWTTQTNPKNIHGFRNIMFICAAIVIILLLIFGAVPLYNYLVTGSRQGTRDRRLRLQKSIRYRSGNQRHPVYLPL